MPTPLKAHVRRHAEAPAGGMGMEECTSGSDGSRASRRQPRSWVDGSVPLTGRSVGFRWPDNRRGQRCKPLPFEAGFRYPSQSAPRFLMIDSFLIIAMISCMFIDDNFTPCFCNINNRSSLFVTLSFLLEMIFATSFANVSL